MANSQQPLVSINIPTFNSGNTLDECLSAVSNSSYRDIEIIIIDSHSRDNTLEIAKKYNAKIFQAETLAEARKIGVENSQGKYIFLLDSDQIIEKNTISDAVRVCETEGYDGVTFFERSITNKNTFIEKVIAYDKWLFHSLHDDDSILGSAIPRFFKTGFLRRIDYGNNPPITFEHSIMHNEIIKMGARIKFINVYINHYETYTLSQVFKKFYRYGFYYIPAFRNNKQLVICHSLPRRSYFHPKSLTHPLLFMGLILMYCAKALAASLGALSYLLKKK